MKIIRIKNISLVSILFSTFLFQHCCTVKENRNIWNSSEGLVEVVLPLPRGIIEATLIPKAITTVERKKICEAMITTVHKTGGGIRPIAEKIEYLFEISQPIMNQLKKNIGVSIRCQITEIPQMGTTTEPTKYKIVRILN